MISYKTVIRTSRQGIRTPNQHLYAVELNTIKMVVAFNLKAN
jgi:hypothetical protein